MDIVDLVYKTDMANFKEILKIRGVVMAGEFSLAGNIIAYDGNFPIEIANKLANICSINILTSKFLSEGLGAFPQIGVFEFKKTILDFDTYKLCIDVETEIFLLLGEENVCLDEIMGLNFNNFKNM